jgi:hypothetical protein
MPSKAKLVTRSATATTVTADSIPKGAGLSNAELDSNFLNLRDQSIAITDGTTTTDIESGETITFSGASVTGNTVTITGGGGGGSVNLEDLVISASGTANKITNPGGALILDANIASHIWLAHNQIYVGEQSDSNDYTPGGNTGSPVDITNAEGGDIRLQSGTNEAETLNPGIIIRGPNSLGSNSGRIELIAPGSAQVKIDNHLWPSALGTNNQILVTDGSGGLSWTANYANPWASPYTITDPGSSSTLDINFINGQTQVCNFGANTDFINIGVPSNLPAGRPMYLILTSSNLSWTTCTMTGYFNENGNSSFSVGGGGGGVRKWITIISAGSSYYATISPNLINPA